MNASPIKAVVNDTGKACQACGARPRYPHTLGCTVAYPVVRKSYDGPARMHAEPEWFRG